MAALLLAPAEEREAIVVSIESKMVEMYAPVHTDDPVDQRIDEAEDDEPRMMNLIDPPVQRDGFVEQMIHTYEIKEDDQGEQGEIATRSMKPNTRAG